MTRSGHRIVAVEEGSPAARAGIIEGDMLAAASGEAVADLIDYLALTDKRRVELRILSAAGLERDVVLVRRGGEPLGLSFERPLMSARKLCANKCVFCFVDQNPACARDTLGVKDDDWRESLMLGNYVTLTNVSDAEFARILKRRVQPLYLSVHAYDPALRERLMCNRRARGLWKRLLALCENALSFHAQIVLCPGINDGEALSETLSELVKLPAMKSAAVVPVGITAHRENLYPLAPFTQESARDALQRIEAVWPGRVFAADELYLLANEPLPPYEAYGDFPQIENGVGMLRLFEDEFAACIEETIVRPRAAIITGEAAAPFLLELVRRSPSFEDVCVVPVKNRFFGGYVNVAGLVTGSDIVAAVGASARDFGRILLPESMLRDGEVFLDDMPLSALSETLGVPVEAVAVRGDALWGALTAAFMIL